MDCNNSIVTKGAQPPVPLPGPGGWGGVGGVVGCRNDFAKVFKKNAIKIENPKKIENSSVNFCEFSMPGTETVGSKVMSFFWDG